MIWIDSVESVEGPWSSGRRRKCRVNRINNYLSFSFSKFLNFTILLQFEYSMSALIQIQKKHSFYSPPNRESRMFHSCSTILATILTSLFFIISWFLFCHWVWIDFTYFINFIVTLTWFWLILDNIGWSLCGFNNLIFIWFFGFFCCNMWVRLLLLVFLI